MAKPMHFIVTGGAGFIGSHVTEQLLIEGHSVTVVNNLTTGSLENLSKHPRLRLLLKNILFNFSIQTILRKFLTTGIFLWLILNILKHIYGDILIVSVLHHTALGLIFTWVIAQVSRGLKGIIGNIFEFEPLVYIGKISYGIYLIHPFMTYVIGKAFPILAISDHSSSLVNAVVSTVATIILATISWQFFERPINDLKRFFQYSDKVST